jgi:circadian clock protein KaiC
MTTARTAPSAGRFESTADLPTIPKAPTGIRGLDEVTGGGLPRGRPTLVTGSAGCGKTLFGVEFLVHGALEHDEPGVLVAFEESREDLAANVGSLGFDLARMEADGLLVVDAIRFDPTQVVETGDYDLEGLFVRLGYAVDSIGAKRVVLDTLEVLFSALDDSATVRAETARLFRWLKARGLTAVVTGERGVSSFTRHGIEEYVSDCVIVLDHRVSAELSTRRLRVVKYRGSLHGTNEYPFLVTDRGLVVLPISSLRLDHDAPTERLSTGLDRLDHMLGGGVYRGSSTLVSGEAGTGKTTLAAMVVAAACARGERSLFVSLEESPAQLVRDMGSVGIDLQRWVDAGLLEIWSGRPSAYGLELHLATLLRVVDEHQPEVVALDALSALDQVGSASEVTSAVTREMDLLKERGITTVLTSLTPGDTDGPLESSSLGVTSLIDTWMLLRNLETDGERNRLLFVRKSRGSAHSNQVREFVLSDDGPRLLDVYVGPAGVLTGSARLAQAAQDRRRARQRAQVVDERQRRLRRRAHDVEAQIEALRADLAAETAEVEELVARAREESVDRAVEAAAMSAHRWQDPLPDEPSPAAGAST